MMREGYSVTVSKWGEPILTIEHECLSGKSDFTPEEEEAIRSAGEHLKSFIGDEEHECFLCGGTNECKPDCPLTETV